MACWSTSKRTTKCAGTARGSCCSPASARAAAPPGAGGGAGEHKFAPGNDDRLSRLEHCNVRCKSGCERVELGVHRERVHGALHRHSLRLVATLLSRLSVVMRRARWFSKQLRGLLASTSCSQQRSSKQAARGSSKGIYAPLAEGVRALRALFCVSELSGYSDAVAEGGYRTNSLRPQIWPSQPWASPVRGWW